MSVRQRATEYKEWVATFTIIILILVFGCALVGIGVKLIHGQQRMEQRQAVALAVLRAQAGASPEPEPEPDKRHGMRLLPPVAVLLAVAIELRQHWVRTVSAAAGALAATAVVLGLILGHNPAAAGPPVAGQPTTAVLTGATTAPTPAVSLSGARSAPGASATAPRPSSFAAVPVVLTGEAPARPQPTVAPSSSVPVPSRSPSAPDTPPKSPITPSPTTPSSSAACLIAVNASPILAACLLGT